MSFLDLVTHFPGLLPSIAIGVLLVFWLLTIAGLLDMDSIGPDWLGSGDDADVSGLPEMLLALGLDRLPFSIVISGVAFFWWLISMLATALLLPLLPLPLPLWLGGTLVLLAALVLSVLLASFTLRPLKPLFAVDENVARESAIGRRCRILTLSVEDNFGQAEVQMGGGTRLTLQVYAAEPNRLVRDSQAVVLAFDARRRRYLVAELEPV